MRNTIQKACGFSLATLALTLGVASCGETTTTSSDVAYEDGYSTAYYYPAAVGYAGVSAVGFGYYGIYAATPVYTGNGVGGAGGHAATGGAGGAVAATGGAGGAVAATGGAGGASLTAPGTTTVRGAVAEAIRNIALGGSVCPGQVTVTHTPGTNVCGFTGGTLNIVFNGCQLSAGGTVDGTVNVQLDMTASATDCSAASTTVSIAYTSTVTNLSYAGTGGAKIVIPSEKDTSTFSVTPGQKPTSIAMMSTGEIQRTASDGSSYDLSFTGMRTFSSISIGHETYTLDGAINVTDKAGGTATITGTGLQIEKSCCKPIGGTLATSRTGGGHAGSHSIAFSSSCGTATLDGKSVTLPACL
jgi:hypothetical protein